MKFANHLACAVLMLAAGGCSAGPSHQPSSPAAHAAGKPGATVDVQLLGSGKLASGAQAPLQLQFRSARGDADLSVEYRTEAGLALQSPAKVQLRTNQEGIASDAPVVRALVDGRHYLNVFVTYGGRSRAFSIPVTVGTGAGAAMKPGGQPVTTPKGENLIILPAENKR